MLKTDKEIAAMKRWLLAASHSEQRGKAAVKMLCGITAAEIAIPQDMIEAYHKHRKAIAEIPDVFRFAAEAEEICWRAYYEWMGRAANYAIEAALKNLDADGEESE